MIRPILPRHPLPMPNPVKLPSELLVTMCCLLIIIGIAVMSVWLMLKAQKKNSITPDMLTCLLLTPGIGLLTFVSYGLSLAFVKGLILSAVLIYASVSDIYKREVPDCVWIMIGILSFVSFDKSNLLYMLLGAAVVFLPQLIMAMIRPNKAIGGADIKISTVAAFLLGTEKGILALIIGLSIAVVVMLIARKAKKVNKGEPFPLIPFLSVGIMAAYLL